MKRIIITSLLFVSVLFTNAAIITVNNNNDTGPGSLRDAVTNAGSGDTINFGAVTNGTYINLNSDITINKKLYIIGNGHTNTMLYGTSVVNIFNVQAGYLLTVAKIGIQNGTRGITAAGSVDVSECEIKNSISDGVYVSGDSLRMKDCFIHNCGGKGIYSKNTGVTFIMNSTVSSNTNSATAGFFKDIAGPLQIVNCTFHGNVDGIVTIAIGSGFNTEIKNNSITANTGVGLKIDHMGSGTNPSNMKIQNNIIFGNATYDMNVIGATGSNPINVNNIGATGTSNLGTLSWYSTANPYPSGNSLSSNGGLWNTVPLTSSSTSAIDNANVTYAPALDGRGYTRYNNPDIGAFEYSGSPCNAPNFDLQPANLNACATGNAVISFNIGGSSPFNFQWQLYNGTVYNPLTNAGAYSGVNTSGLNITGVTGAMNNNNYRCVVNNACGTVISNVAVLQVSNITVTPNQTNINCYGGSNGAASLSVSGGIGSYTYYWSPGSYTTNNVSGLAAGTYTCSITDGAGCNKQQTFTITQPTIFASSCSGTDVGCYGASTGGVTMVPTGGTTPYTYSWSPSGGTGAIASGLSAGSYTCTATDANGCTSVQMKTVNQPSTPVSASNSSSNVTCNGGTNGSASVTASGGTPSYTYNWAPSGGTNATASGLAPGNYTCTITDTKGCTITKTSSVTEPAALTVNSSSNNVSCNGGANGSATVTVGGGTSPYSYSWAPSGGTAATATGLAAGTYTCSVTDNNGCTSLKTITITQPAVLTVGSSSNNVACNGGSNGSATVTPSGGTSPYNYSWAPSGGTGATATGLAVGVYTCTVTDVNSCTSPKTITITQPTTLASTLPSQTNVGCNGASNGSATVAASGGTTPYSYSWAPSGGTAAPATGLVAATYTCTITDANGCTTTQTAVISQPTALTINGTPTNASCFGSANGTATVSVSGGTAPYSYSWAPSGGTTVTATNLPAGSYTCTVNDVNSCSIMKIVTVAQPSLLSASVTPTNASCFGGSNGTATVSASGGTPGYTYSWAPNGGTTTSATGLAAGVYTCTVTDANGCTTNNTGTISQPSALSANAGADASVCIGGSVSLTSNVTGGTGGITYNWTPVGSLSSGTVANPTASPTTTTTYTLAVTDANGCTANDGVLITVNPLPTVSANNSGPFCAGSTINLSASASGGTTFSWTGPNSFSSSTQNPVISNATSAMAGTYTLTATNGTTGCSNTATTTIVFNASPTATITGNANFCSGSTTTLSASTSTAGSGTITNYQWLLSGANVGPAAAIYVVNTAGNYQVTITNSNGCSTTSSTLAVASYTPPTASFTGNTSFCAGSTTVLTNTSTSGSGTIVSYQWMLNGSAVNGATSTTYTAATAGNYALIVTNTNGCTDTSSVVAITVSSGPVLTPSSTNITCNGMVNGTASINVTGGTAPYTYSWMPSGATTNSVASLAPGTHNCTVTDANGCSASQSVNITQPPVLGASATTTNATCFGLCNGSIAGTATGGVNPYTYNYMPGAIATANATGLCAGAYTLTVTDANGCTATTIQTITQPAALTVSVSGTNISCFGNVDGSASATATGGTAPYMYNWSCGATTGVINGLQAGNYTASVSDQNGCTASSGTTITSPTDITITLTPSPSSCGSNTGAVNSTVTGGVAPYTYYWTNGGTTASISGVLSGQYMLQVKDASACYKTAVAIVADANGPTVTINSITHVSCNGLTNGAVDISVAGGLTPYSIEWSHGAVTEDVSALAAAPYEVKVTDANGCLATMHANVTQPDSISFTTSYTSPSVCGGNNGTVTATTTGGTAPYTFLWSANAAGQTTATASNVGAGYYKLTATDAHGCVDSTYAAVSDPNAPIVVLDSLKDAGCILNGGSGEINISVSGGTGTYSYLWSNGVSTEDMSGLGIGYFSVIITDGAGCKATSVVYLNGQRPGTAQICLITVDTSNNHNIIVWEKNVPGVAEYKIFRETSIQNTYTLIATIPATDMSQFEDTVANAGVQPWRYKILVTDSCGIQSEYSLQHKSIHLVALINGSAVDLSWDEYQGFPYTYYYISRYHPSTGWHLIDSTLAGITTYTDATPPLPATDLEYLVEVKPTTPCTPTRGAINTSRSNIKTARFMNAGIAETSVGQSLMIYPNPASSELNINVSKKGKFYVQVYDVQGRRITETSAQHTVKIAVSDIASGVYMINVVFEDGSIYHTRFIKQ